MSITSAEARGDGASLRSRARPRDAASARQRLSSDSLKHTSHELRRQPASGGSSQRVLQAAIAPS